MPIRHFAKIRFCKAARVRGFEFAENDICVLPRPLVERLKAARTVEEIVVAKPVEMAAKAKAVERAVIEHEKVTPEPPDEADAEAETKARRGGLKSAKSRKND